MMRFTFAFAFYCDTEGCKKSIHFDGPETHTEGLLNLTANTGWSVVKEKCYCRQCTFNRRTVVAS